MDIFKKYGNGSCGCDHDHSHNATDNIFWGGVDSGAINVFYDGPVSSQDYNKMINKPQINDVELVGNLTLEQLGFILPEIPEFEEMSDTNLDEIMYL